MTHRLIRARLAAVGAACAALVLTLIENNVDARAGTAALGTPFVDTDSFDFQTGADPQIFSDTEIAAIRTETAGRGFLILQDGDLLHGRVLAEGVLMLPGARVFYEPGAEIVSCGEINLFLGTMVPVPIGPEELQVSVAEGGIATGCTTTQTVSGPDGTTTPDLPPISVVGNTTIDANAYFSSIDGENAPNINVAGDANAPTIIATGGKGGDGANISIKVSGTLVINGIASNAKGGNGASVTATGLDGLGCGECGGQAYATGGAGGKAGSLTIEAQTLIWNPPPPAPPFHQGQGRLSIKTGGLGGEAFATGGAGGHCGLVCGGGGDAGDAIATGGKAGDSNSITIRVGLVMVPDPNFFVRRAVGVEVGAAGGKALAVGGLGGYGGPCPCPQDGGAGGDAGSAEATGGEGGSGTGASGAMQLTAFGGIRRHLGASDGGAGGNAEAQGGYGGHAMDAATCKCDLNDVAGAGGNGGDNGDANATGGKGGKGGGSPIKTINSGSGGNALATCQKGGRPGNGGSCDGDQPPDCIPGTSGLSGNSATSTELGGEPGDVVPNASSGSHGQPQLVITTDCGEWIAAQDGKQHCPKDTPCGDPTSGDCCVPHNSPGCANPGCCATICDIEPFCCADSWDGLCASLASIFCSDCAPASN